MKSVFAVILLTIYVSHAQFYLNENELSSLKGKIKTINDTVYVATKKNGEFIKKARPKSISQLQLTESGKILYLMNKNLVTGIVDEIKRTYDTNGFLIEENIKSPGGKTKNSYQYDSLGRRVKEINKTPFSLDVTWTIYDSLGRIHYTINADVDDTAKFDEKTFFKYDKYNNWIEKLSIDEDGDSDTEYQKFKYDNNGKIIEESRFDNDGLLKDKYLYEYNSDGEVTKKTDVDEEGKVTDINHYSYDSKNKPLAYKHEEAGIITGALCFQYDSLGRLIKDWRIDEGQTVDKNIYTYDSGNQLRTKLDYSEEGNIEREYIYKEYDNNGNWSKIFIRDGRDMTCSIRKIEYYP